MDSTILDLLGDDLKRQAFQSGLKKLEAAPQLDLDALRLCIRLWPSLTPVPEPGYSDSSSGNPIESIESMASSQAPEGHTLAEELCNLVVARIPHEQLEPGHFYTMAEIMCSDASFANVLFREKIYPRLLALLSALSAQTLQRGDRMDEDEDGLRASIIKATAYLTLLKCSYWLPSHNFHVVDPNSLGLLSRFIGLSELDNVAHDAISALLSLLKRGEPIVVAPPSNASQKWLQPHTTMGRVALAAPIIDGSLWGRLSMLELQDHKSGLNPSIVFRTWFQWVSQAVLDGIQLDCLQDPSYWDRVRTGLLHGHADQRKYCIGIIRQSLLIAQSDISTPTMQFRVAERVIYLKAYEKYAALYEIIVLDRYVNQVQACVPELTRLFQSKVTPLMASTLLSAALSPLVQDGVRKVIGNWYMDYVSKAQGDIQGHIHFLLTGFLPWATLGELFTSTLMSTRETTTAVHGAALTNVIARFVSATEDAPPPAGTAMSTSSTREALDSGRRQVIMGVIDFIIDAGGRIFQYSISYLLEGLVKGLPTCHSELPLRERLSSTEAGRISRISRMPCLPEIASDLYGEYCSQILDSISPGWTDIDAPAYHQMRIQRQRLLGSIESEGGPDDLRTPSESLRSLEGILEQLDASNHRCIQDEKFVPMCKALIKSLNHADPNLVQRADLMTILEAFWEEADRRQFCRPVAIHIPSLLFHPTCVRVYVQRQTVETGVREDGLHTFLSRVVDRLQRLSEGRTYVLALLVTSVRSAVLSCPELIDVLPIENYIIRFTNNPPTTKSEFMFEVAAAEKLQQYQSHRSYTAYYGQREWHAYAAMIDLVHGFPKQYVAVTKNILDRLIEPWKEQTANIPILSKWKNVLQLQMMLLLADSCINEQDVDAYLVIFNHALVVEPWPRYRFLLEWIIARIYYRFPGKTSQILEDLDRLDDSSSTHIASLMKLGVLVAPRETESFSAKLMTQLVPFSASPKVQIRHESNYAIPIVFDLALSKRWRSITENAAFVSLNAFIRSLEKFQVTPWTIRTLKLDAVKDFTLVNIFQGQYLTIESPEKARVAYEDFVALREADRASGLVVPPERVPLGIPLKTELAAKQDTAKISKPRAADITTPTAPAFFQTKSGFDLESLHPQSGPPGQQNQCPASVILIASLIDNPTNLGGLSRISESFGLEALYIADLKQMAHKDFKATSVTSEKHFPIRELKLARVPNFLVDMKKSGYEIVGIEQTDRSGILGTDGVEGDDSKSAGILPKKCVLVLGSEKGGISAEVLAVLDRCVEIRTVGVTRSLNVQTAGGIAVYEWWRKWHGAA